MIVYALSFAAGVLTTLSPCVLPMIPIIVGSSLSKSRWGPLAMSLGLTLSFVFLGVLTSVLGSIVSFNAGVLRNLTSAILGLVGIILLFSRLQSLVSGLMLPVSNWAQTWSLRFPEGIIGQFFLGATLGLIWSPCSGPTLGAALALAAASKNLSQVVIQMFLFGLGASLPLGFLGYLSSGWLASRRKVLASSGSRGKLVLGVMLVLVSFSTLTGFDKKIESVVLDHLPESWIKLTTSI